MLICEAKGLSFYVSITLTPRSYDSTVPSSGGGSVTLRLSVYKSFLLDFKIPFFWDSQPSSFHDSVQRGSAPKEIPGGFRAWSRGEGR